MCFVPVNTNLLTVVLPTSTNGLREPKMYYFENSTSNNVSLVLFNNNNIY
jgi:hypothetical protein